MHRTPWASGAWVLSCVGCTVLRRLLPRVGVAACALFALLPIPVQAQEASPAEPAAAATVDSEDTAVAPAQPDDPPKDLTPEQLRAREYESQFTLDLGDDPGEPPAAEPPTPFAPSEAVPMWRLIVDMLWKLVLVVGIIWGLTWVLRRTRYAPIAAPDGSRMRIVDTLRLSADRALHVVEVQGQVLLVGSAPNALTLVARLEDAGFGGAGIAARAQDSTDMTFANEQSAGHPDFFDSLVQAERSFDVADLSPGALGQDVDAPLADSRGPDPLKRAMDVLESLEHGTPSERGPKRRQQGTYDQRGRLR